MKFNISDNEYASYENIHLSCYATVQNKNLIYVHFLDSYMISIKIRISPVFISKVVKIAIYIQRSYDLASQHASADS